MKNKRSFLAMFLLIVLIFNFAACRITPSDSALLCPNCSAQYTKGDSKCAECGLSFVVENTVKCEACGADNSANSTACATCGNVFAQTPNGENNGNGNTDDHRPYFFLGGFHRGGIQRILRIADRLRQILAALGAYGQIVFDHFTTEFTKHISWILS